MAGCPFTRKPENCVRRQAWQPMPSDCRVCDFRGRTLPEDASQSKPRSVNEIPRRKEKASGKDNVVIQTTTSGIKEHQVLPNEKNDHHEKEEHGMDAKKDLVLRKIQEHKAITRGALAGMIRLKREEVEPIAKALEAEGKIKMWPGKRSDSMIYTTPDLPNPLEEIDGKKPAGKKKAAPRAAKVKRQRNIDKRQTDISPANPVPASSPTPKNGGGSAENSLKDLPSFRRIQNYNLQLTAAMVHGDPEGIDLALEEIACTALDWRRERRAAG